MKGRVLSFNQSIFSSITMREDIMTLKNEMEFREMTVLPCHTIFLLGRTGPGIAELDFSRVGGFPGEGRFYLQHAMQAVLHSAEDKSRLNCITGGLTNSKAVGRSEAQSYLDVIKDHGWFGHQEVKGRTIIEEYARDSLENLLFSIVRFKQETSRWPDKITVVGWKFKEKRFDLHRQALKWPQDRFTYIGVNNPEGKALDDALAAEAALVEKVKGDLFMVGPELASKREQRNPFHRRHPYRNVVPELTPFFDFLDRNTFTDDLPWLNEYYKEIGN